MAGEPEYRWDWVSPSLTSKHEDGLVYLGGNRLFISRDRGLSWTRTEDLTRDVDRETLEIMGDPEFMAALRESIQEADDGRLIPLADVIAELGLDDSG